ncbi:mediator complex subunit MED14-domain-containing protein [Xylogone sp. PMI_703]|nr:mediator complex subunit MED14-domain-containing protein [Xylogone sp. PMI_703]
MPGVIMDDGSRNGIRTDHDRIQRLNGINGVNHHTGAKSQEKGKGWVDPKQNRGPAGPGVSNGLDGSLNDATRKANSAGQPASQSATEKVNELPPELVHITQGYLPLSRLLTRLAQQTHNSLSNKIVEVAQMPMHAAAVNGNGSHAPAADDNSVENVNKKLRLLTFAQETHANWTKALVLTEWSRKAEDVSKIIDLKVHLDRQRSFYDIAVHEMMEMKRSLIHARVPNLDLKTALEVLSTGKAPWMPDLGYIQPPLLTAQELLKSLENLNTLLSIRLNLHEYEKIPFQFKNYTIQSGRVTFRVAGEFEVDLTIADEDPEKQFWFIDFRFLFSPALSDLPVNSRAFIEDRVNAVLLKDGLLGCYKFLHELVLTHQISEFRRQAVELSRGRWIDCLKVEPLNRALSIQYWVDRYGKDGHKSWILLGVHSGRRKDGLPDPKATSRLFVRWFRDSKEVKDVNIPFDTAEISTETLLKAVIAKHVEHILTSTYDKLRVNPLFSSHEAALSLSISQNEPMDSVLKVQISNKEYASINVEPITGKFVFSPASRILFETEYRLNNRSKDPAVEASAYIENLRCMSIAEEIACRGLSVGWERTNNPGLKQDDLKPLLPKDTLQVSWFRRPGWSKDWLIAVTLSMSGERWWLMEITNSPTGVKIASSFQIPIKSLSPVPNYSFLSSLNVFTAALISHYTNLKALHARRVPHVLQHSTLSSSVRLPAIFIRLSKLLPSKNISPRTGKPWARDVLKLAFQGLEYLPPTTKNPASDPSPKEQLQELPTSVPDNSQSNPGGDVKSHPDDNLVMISEARVVVPVNSALSVLKEKVDRDIAFHAKSGTFAFRLQSKIGEPVISDLVERLIRVECLVDFVDVVRRHEKSLHCETISLGKIVFTYGDVAPQASSINVGSSRKGFKAIVDFGSTENKMTLTLERNNPHIRILDHLTDILNSPVGLDGIATLLPLTLPTLRGLTSVEENWSRLQSQGEAFVFVRSVDWYIIRYNLSPVRAQVLAGSRPQRVIIEVKLLQRKGEPWWYIRRTDPHDREGDEIDEKLRVVWNSSGEGWRGMRISAAAQATGVEECLRRVDEVMSRIATGDKAPNMMPTAVMGEAKLDTRQLPSSNQNKNQNQKRVGNYGGNEVVILD